MADFSITAANVIAGGVVPTKTAGEALVAGEAVYKKVADGKYYKAQADGNEEEAKFAGVAVNNCAAGQPFSLVEAGELTVGSALGSAGKAVVLSAAAGKLAPIADLLTGHRLTIVGYSKSATVLVIQSIVTGTQVP
ncbi:hypothetical protein RAS1_14310 [Phycisphaerae bacterium RAS1]|nr:hypothetical protein RAS1_14310 [Phycisphaerae bacterium RAS1]